MHLPAHPYGLALRIETLNGPVDTVDIGQVEAVIPSHLAVDQSVEFCIHGQEQILMLQIPGQIRHFMGIVFKVEQLDIVDVANLFDRCR